MANLFSTKTKERKVQRFSSFKALLRDRDQRHITGWKGIFRQRAMERDMRRIFLDGQRSMEMITLKQMGYMKMVALKSKRYKKIKALQRKIFMRMRTVNKI